MEGAPWGSSGWPSIIFIRGAWQGPCWHAPRFVVLHMGTNDLISRDKVQLKHLLQCVISECKRLLPYSVIIWSDILPRHFYVGAWSQSSIESKRKSVNKTAHALVWANGGKVIKHRNFHWSNQGLFRDDFVHLSVYGQFLFTGNLQNALHFFNRYTSEQTFEAV